MSRVLMGHPLRGYFWLSPELGNLTVVRRRKFREVELFLRRRRRRRRHWGPLTLKGGRFAQISWGCGFSRRLELEIQKKNANFDWFKNIQNMNFNA